MIIDADAHVIETEATWDHLDPADVARRPVLAASGDDAERDYWIVDGKVAGIRLPTLSEKQLQQLSVQLGRKVDSPMATRTMEDVDLRIAHMDELGIDVQVLHNTLFLSPVTERPDTEVALCRSWNRWMAGVWEQGRGRLRWTCVVPTLDLDEAAKEVTFAREHGAVGVCLRPYEHNIVVTDPYFFPIFELSERLDMPITIHVGNGHPELFGALQSRQQLFAGFLTHGLPTVAACFTLLSSDIAKKFPALRWGFIEVSAGWIPWLLHNLWRRGAVTNRNVFEDNRIFVTTQMDDDHEYVMGYVGENVLMIGTDYGHTDVASEMDAIATFRQLPTLSAAAKSKVLSDNPRALFGL